MTTQDVKTLSLITTLTLSVFILMIVMAVTVDFPIGQYYTLPTGWFVGAVMVWGYHKVMAVTSSAVSTKR